jgi:lipoprotein-anchoring transpeptidase ErfK/SrfK
MMETMTGAMIEEAYDARTPPSQMIAREPSAGAVMPQKRGYFPPISFRYMRMDSKEPSGAAIR